MKPVVFEKQEATNKAYFSGRCQAYTTDASGLASIRNKEASNPDDHVILPELISKEPLGPLVRRGDDEFFAIVKWVVFALLEAEEYGITQANVDQMKTSSTDPVVQRILGTVGRHRQAARPGQGLGLPRHQGRRQLRRDLRAQRRPEVGAEAAARRQQPVEQGRPDVRAAGALRPDGRRSRRDARCRPAAQAATAGTWRSQAFRGLSVPGRSRSALIARSRLVPAAQHAGQHACARHPERLRLPHAARRLRHRRERRRLRLGRQLLARPSWSACRTRCAWPWSASCSPPCSARWSASAACRATCWCAACAAATSSCSATCRCCCSCSCWYFVLTEVLPPIDERAAAAAGRVLQQERPAVPGAGVGKRALGHARRRWRSAALGAWALAALARARASRPPAERCRCCWPVVLARRRSAARAGLARSAARRRTGRARAHRDSMSSAVAR